MYFPISLCLYMKPKFPGVKKRNRPITKKNPTVHMVITAWLMKSFQAERNVKRNSLPSTRWSLKFTQKSSTNAVCVFYGAAVGVGTGNQVAAAIVSIGGNITQSICLLGRQASSISARILHLRHSQKADNASKRTVQLTG